MSGRDDPRSRRDYLRALLGTGVLTGVAGCGALTESGTDDQQAASTAANGATTTAAPTDAASSTGTASESSTPSASFPSLSAGDPTYRRWQPASGDMAGILNAAHNVRRYRERKSDLSPGTYESGTSWAMFGDYVGVEYEELDGVLVGLSAPGPVLVGTFARSDVTSRLESMPYEQFDSRGPVTYYRWDDATHSRFVGVSGEGVIHGPGRQDADDPATQFVQQTSVLFETARGDRPALHEEDDVYRQYTDAVGWPLVAGVTPPRQLGGNVRMGLAGSIGNVVAEEVASSVRMGYTRHVADGSLVDRYWLRTTDDASMSPGDVLSAYRDSETQTELANEGESVAVRRSGRVVEVAVLDPFEQSGGGADPVLVSLDVTREGRTVTVEHVAGEALPLSRVTVLAGTDPIDALGSDTLSSGGTRSFDVPEGTETVRVLYDPPNTDQRTILAETE